MSESRRDDEATIPAEMLVPAVGALTFASGEPVCPREIADAFPRVSVEEVERAFDELSEAYERGGTGLGVERVAGGYRLVTRSDVGALVRRFFRQRHRTRLSPAALETLAIVAYRQPVTAPEIQSIRGKDPSAALRSLLDKKLLRILGKKKVVGTPLLYGTSKHFLDHFGLNSLDDLPSIQDFDEFVGVLAEAEAAREPSEADEPDERETAGESAPSSRQDGDRPGSEIPAPVPDAETAPGS